MAIEHEICFQILMVDGAVNYRVSVVQCLCEVEFLLRALNREGYFFRRKAGRFETKKGYAGNRKNGRSISISGNERGTVAKA